MIGEVTINWHLSEPRVLLFNHWNGEAGKWTVFAMEFRESLKRETPRQRRENAIMSEFNIGGLEAVQNYGLRHAQTFQAS